MNKIIKLIFFIIFTLNFATAKSQNLKSHKIFFKSKVPEFESWLKQFNQSKSDTTIIKFEKIYFKNDTILGMKLEIPDEYNWNRLNDTINILYHTTLGKLLINKFAFLMDLQISQCYIIANGIDVKIVIKTRKGKIETNIQRKQGDISDNRKIKIGNIKNIRTGEKINSTKSIDIAKSLLQKGLKEYFKQYEAFFEDYQFKVIYKLDNKLIIDVNNVVDVVLNKGHFEHIRIDFTFVANDDNLDIQYKVNAKHAAGIIWAPFNSDYKEIAPNNQKFIDFNLTLKNQIDEILKK